MSINSALLAGASGLISNSNALASISDNIANVNTVGYKRASAVFTPLYDSDSSTKGYSAAGVNSSSRLAKRPADRRLIADRPRHLRPRLLRRSRRCDCQLVRPGRLYPRRPVHPGHHRLPAQ